jgi:chromosome segregation and condensation protein ScpB
MNTVRKGKINRHEKITILLLSGKPVSPREIFHVFEGTDQEKVLYRLSTNIYNIRKDGGVIKVLKEGRKVSGYQLMNPQEFNQYGRYVGKQTTPVQVTVRHDSTVLETVKV